MTNTPNDITTLLLSNLQPKKRPCFTHVLSGSRFPNSMLNMAFRMYYYYYYICVTLVTWVGISFKRLPRIQGLYIYKSFGRCIVQYSFRHCLSLNSERNWSAILKFILSKCVIENEWGNAGPRNHQQMSFLNSWFL